MRRVIPLLLLAGAVPRTDRLKRTHQSMDNAALFEPITKYSVEVEHPDNVPEALSNAFRSATSTNPGATFSKSAARRYDCGNDLSLSVRLSHSLNRSHT